MKIHEKDPNSATAAAPPSPLKRRRLSSKRKLSHDAESEREDPAPAKKVWDWRRRVSSRGFWQMYLSSLFSQSGDLADVHPRLFHLCFPTLFSKGSKKRVLVCLSSLEPLS